MLKPALLAAKSPPTVSFAAPAAHDSALVEADSVLESAHSAAAAGPGPGPCAAVELPSPRTICQLEVEEEVGEPDKTADAGGGRDRSDEEGDDVSKHHSGCGGCTLGRECSDCTRGPVGTGGQGGTKSQLGLENHSVERYFGNR